MTAPLAGANQTARLSELPGIDLSYGAWNRGLAFRASPEVLKVAKSISVVKDALEREYAQGTPPSTRQGSPAHIPLQS